VKIYNKKKTKEFNFPSPLLPKEEGIKLLQGASFKMFDKEV
jgi:hypothetical protein